MQKCNSESSSPFLSPQGCSLPKRSHVGVHTEPASKWGVSVEIWEGLEQWLMGCRRIERFCRWQAELIQAVQEIREASVALPAPHTPVCGEQERVQLHISSLIQLWVLLLLLLLTGWRGTSRVLAWPPDRSPNNDVICWAISTWERF